MIRYGTGRIKKVYKKDDIMKKCPYCGKEIPQSAKICPYCNKDLEKNNNIIGHC